MVVSDGSLPSNSKTFLFVRNIKVPDDCYTDCLEWKVLHKILTVTLASNNQ